MSVDFKNATIRAYLLLGVILFNLIAILDMPYFYYGFLRVYNFIAASLLAFLFYRKELKAQFFLCLFVLIIYNPFIKIRLDREIWSVLNLVVVVCSTFYLFNNRHNLNQV